MSRFIVGLDLGQASDPSAVAAIEQTRVIADNGRPANAYAVRHLERFPLGTPYPAQVERVARLFVGPPLTGRPLAVDQTGVGRPVVDMIRRAGVPCWLRPITISGGHAVHEDERTREITVPKKELVSALQVPLQARRLAIPRDGDGPTLAKELSNFRVKITTAAHETFGSWREGEHDDLVLAVALAIWLAERLWPVGASFPRSRPATIPPGFNRLPPPFERPSSFVELPR